jgi:hypothetical protein
MPAVETVMLVCLVLMLPASLSFLPLAWRSSRRLDDTDAGHAVANADGRRTGAGYLGRICQRRRCREALALCGALGLGALVALGLLLV